MTPLNVPLHPLPTNQAGSSLVVSLPLPPWEVDVDIPGAATVQRVPLGEWPARTLLDPRLRRAWPASEIAQPRAFGNPPRRCLVEARFDGALPAELHARLTRREQAGPVPVAPPVATAVRAEEGEEIYHHRDEELYHYVRREDAAIIVAGGERLRVRLGMLIHDQRRYWQWVTAIPAWEGELSTACTVGGHIYAGPDEDRPMTIAEAKQVEKLSYFEECTISAKAFIVLHDDGAMEVDCHFANIQGYGRGKLAHGLPIIEIEREDLPGAEDLWPETDEGSTETEGGLWRWQPLTSTRIWLGNRWQGGLMLADGAPIPHHVRDSEKGMVSGVGRSFRFTWRLQPQSQLPTRCLAEPTWYLRCGIHGLPVRESSEPEGALRRLREKAVEVFKRNVHPDGMSRGGVYRYLDQQPDGRYELSLDGNESAFILRAACQERDGELYRLGMEAARCVADIGVDHNDFNVHYHGDTEEWSLYSLIYHRFGGLVTAWQESGDPWYLEISEAVANRWISVNRQNQPRQNMGRDAEPVEGILMLFDATGKDHYFVEAEKIALDVARSLFADGTWRSGFGVGPYWGTNALRGQAWNGSHLLAGIAEFLFRAAPATSPHHAYLLERAVTLVHGLCRSIDADYGGFHRTSGSFLLRRFALIAELAGDTGLQAKLTTVCAGILAAFDKDPDAFFTTGHHCGGYLDGPRVWASLDWTTPAAQEETPDVLGSLNRSNAG